LSATARLIAAGWALARADALLPREMEPLLPAPGNTAGHGGRPEKHPRRRMLDAIFYLVRGGLAWR